MRAQRSLPSIRPGLAARGAWALGPEVTPLIVLVPNAELVRCTGLLRRAGFNPLPLALQGAEPNELALAESPADERYVVGDIEVDARAHVARRNGVPVRLSPVEFELLLALIRRKGQLVTKKELRVAAWPGRHANITGRVLAMHILNLRRKLEVERNRPRHILTVWGVGYRLVD
ncbi:MAG TPA: winged helix-turn-helix domain-containing protein [Gemmatimonadaceae bacterium]|nr:winged helix-turn-helix domain-containing protein [Gemmatimonadaceae bacterium]